MDKNIKFKVKEKEFDVVEEDGFVDCYKVVELNIYGNQKHFEGYGHSIRAKGNIFDEDFGKALAEVRANQAINHQLEIALIKYSFDHMLEPTKKETTLTDLLKWASLPMFVNLRNY